MNAAGMWARQFGALAGSRVPLQAAEHYYLLTDTVPGMDAGPAGDRGPGQLRLLPARGRRDAGRAVRAGGAPWSLDGVPRTSRSASCRRTGSGVEPFLGPALNRIPSLADTGVRTFFCGPESFTADVRPLLGPAPELDGYFVAAGLELARHPVRRRGRQHGRALDRRRRPRSTRPASPSTGPRRTRRRAGSGPSAPVGAARRLFGDAVWLSWKPSTARNVRRSVLHDQLAAAGAPLRRLG